MKDINLQYKKKKKNYGTYLDNQILYVNLEV